MPLEADSHVLVSGDQAEPALASGAQVPGALNVAHRLPAGWSEHTDEASGRVYYFHAATMSSSWEWPTRATPADDDDGTVVLTDEEGTDLADDSDADDSEEAQGWYYFDGQSKDGPLSVAELAALRLSGTLQDGSPTVLFWRDGMDIWLPIAELPHLKAQIDLEVEDAQLAVAP